MLSSSRSAEAGSRRRSGLPPSGVAAIAVVVALHAWLAAEVLGQPLGVNSAPPSERAPTWWLSNDSVHRPGPGADLFAVTHAALALERGESLYTRLESPPVTPYFFPFRYLPIVAQAMGRCLSKLSPHGAYLAWGLALEAFVLVAIALVVRIARSWPERVAGVALLALGTPLLLELHMGQFTFLTALAAMGAALSGERAAAAAAPAGWRGVVVWLREIALLVLATALKLFPLAALPAWLKRRRWGACAAVAAAVVLLNVAYFSASPGELSAFLAANFRTPLGGLDAGNFSPLYVVYLVAKGAGLVVDDAGFLEAAGVAHVAILSMTVVAILLSREKKLWMGAATVMLAHFAGYVHVWEHHASAVLIIGLVVWLKRHELTRTPGRAWAVAVVACLVALALPTPFALMESDFRTATFSPSEGWSLGAKIFLASSKALPLLALFGLLLFAHVRAGLSWPWRRDGIARVARSLPFEVKPGVGPVCLTLAVLTVLIAFFSLRSEAIWTGFPLDDAWIHRVYARAVAQGYGFQYNLGADEAGATSPLWVVASAPAEWLAGISAGAVAIGVKAISVVLAAAFVLGVIGAARALFEERPAIAALPAAIVAADPRLVFSLLSGMESALVAALWIWAVVAAQRKRWVALAIIAALLPVARPEAALLVPAAWALIAVARDARAPRKAVLLAITLVPAALWAWFCWSTTGHPLPNTFYVKAGAVSDVASIARDTYGAVTSSGYGSTVAFPLGLLGIAAWWWTRRRQAAVAALLLFALPLAYALAVSASRAVRLDGYYWTRWYDPPAFVLGAASACGIVWSVHRLWVSARALRPAHARARAAAIAGLILVAAICALSIWQLARSVRAKRDRLASDIAVIDRMNVAAGRWIDRHALKDQVVGASDAGAVKYFGRRPTIDLGGLNYHPMAFDWSLASEVLRRSSWLVVFPSRLEGTAAMRDFEEEAVFSVRTEEYTICDCPAQTELAIFRRRGAGAKR